ncbi:pseudaminic acid cytidylyltransferase [Methanofollis aquaemaris]|uniref:Pseudaminic acid cytidylyltransferase n=2 Tax=Methanofollis aquaemaris TaxID=126734 RepID=A0A8A3S8J7_9EURY|nr:pseudaminic acid cytidylyltransferase [Methanofollis aquaemaris]
MVVGKNIAVIPARAGSKRVINKNIREMCGRPLISYTIEAAKKCGLFSHIIVSTDGEEIAAISEEYGAEVPFIRDNNLADDYCPVSLVTLDAINKMDFKSDQYENVCQLMANCPLRDDIDILNSHQQFLETRSDAQISVTKYGWFNPWWAMKCDVNNKLTPIFEQQLSERSQDLSELYCPTGAIWWAKINTLRKERTFHCTNRTGWVIPWEKGVDIDTEDDWKLAEILMKNKQWIKND